MKRAIALAGGGPAVGLSIGALKKLCHEEKMQFDVWSTACIGAWLAVVYNQCDPGKELEQTEKFFRDIFIKDDVYSKFPMASVFAPNWMHYMTQNIAFMSSPSTYQNLVVPEAIQEAIENVMSYATDPKQWSLGNFNALIFNDFLRVNPVSRFLTSAIWLGSPNGISQIYYEKSSFLEKIDFDRLFEEGKPTIYHNAYNISKQRLELFGNKHKYAPITAQTLCACSALPYIEQTVEINGDTYCEGATIDTVNFEHLMQNHPDLDEIWVSRILDAKQIRKPDNLYDALNNLVMLFASTTSEDDVRLFKYKVKEHGYKVKVIEIPVSNNINYDWSYGNLDNSIELGYKATVETYNRYLSKTSSTETGNVQALA